MNHLLRVSLRTRFRNHHLQVLGLVHEFINSIINPYFTKYLVKGQCLNCDSKNTSKRIRFSSKVNKLAKLLNNLVLDWL